MCQLAVSECFRVLADTAMVTARIEAQRRSYRLEVTAFAEIDAALAPYRQRSARRLDALEVHLDRGKST